MEQEGANAKPLFKIPLQIHGCEIHWCLFVQLNQNWQMDSFFSWGPRVYPYFLFCLSRIDYHPYPFRACAHGHFGRDSEVKSWPLWLQSSWFSTLCVRFGGKKSLRQEINALSFDRSYSLGKTCELTGVCVSYCVGLLTRRHCFSSCQPLWRWGCRNVLTE